MTLLHDSLDDLTQWRLVTNVNGGMGSTSTANMYICSSGPMIIIVMARDCARGGMKREGGVKIISYMKMN